MKVTVEIEWDEPKEQAWLCADNVAVALHSHCKNTKFKVREVKVNEIRNEALEQVKTIVVSKIQKNGSEGSGLAHDEWADFYNQLEAIALAASGSEKKE